MSALEMTNTHPYLSCTPVLNLIYLNNFNKRIPHVYSNTCSTYLETAKRFSQYMTNLLFIPPVVV